MEYAEVQAYQQSPQAFANLTASQQNYLQGWCEAASGAGIDAVEDLGGRPWPQAGADTIIGVFRPGHSLASWLVVGQAGNWAVACCGDATVSEALPTLADALAIICPVAPLFIPP
jgi:hypothetical protein